MRRITDWANDMFLRLTDIFTKKDSVNSQNVTEIDVTDENSPEKNENVWFSRNFVKTGFIVGLTTFIGFIVVLSTINFRSIKIPRFSKPKDSTSNQTGWIPVKSSNSEITDISSYKELKIGETDSFEANVWKKFKFSPSNTKEQKYLNFYLSKSSKDTITLTFKQVSNGREWSWKHWIDKQGDPQCTLHSGELIAFKGDCLVKADKGCSFNCLIK